MADELPRQSNQELASEPPPDSVVPTASESAVEASDVTPPPAAPKRKGRPPGAKDTVKRVRKPPVQIRIEPIVPVEPVIERVSTPRPKAEPKVETKPTVEIEESPPTPRTMLREASRHFVSLRALVHDNKKTEMYSMYTKKLTPWPV